MRSRPSPASAVPASSARPGNGRGAVSAKMAGRLMRHESNLSAVRSEAVEGQPAEGPAPTHVSTGSTRTDLRMKHAATVKRILAALGLACAVWLPQPASADTAPAMLLAEVYAANVDVTQYWVSEKFDGVRAQWDGHALHFRGGGVIPAPAWFTADFPPVPLDGELWIARNQFDAVSGTVRKTEPVDTEWRRVHYLMFELPGAAGDFSARVRQMQSIVAQAGEPWLEAVEQTRVADRDTLPKPSSSATSPARANTRA